jgi:hypothetical protein
MLQMHDVVEKEHQTESKLVIVLIKYGYAYFKAPVYHLNMHRPNMDAAYRPNGCKKMFRAAWRLSVRTLKAPSGIVTICAKYGETRTNPAVSDAVFRTCQKS